MGSRKQKVDNREREKINQEDKRGPGRVPRSDLRESEALGSFSSKNLLTWKIDAMLAELKGGYKGGWVWVSTTGEDKHIATQANEQREIIITSRESGKVFSNGWHMT